MLLARGAEWGQAVGVPSLLPLAVASTRDHGQLQLLCKRVFWVRHCYTLHVFSHLFLTKSWHKDECLILQRDGSVEVSGNFPVVSQQESGSSGSQSGCVSLQTLPSLSFLFRLWEVHSQGTHH